MKFIFDLALSKCPWLIRWMFYLWFVAFGMVAASFTAGWKALPKVNAHIVGVIETWAAPRIIKHDHEISNLNVKMDSIARTQNDQGQDLRDIKIILMQK